MENSYASLIRQEEAKVALLRAKIAECERRIEVLRSLLSSDDLDAYLQKSVSSEGTGTAPWPFAQPVPTSTSAGFGQPSAGQPFVEPRRRLSEDVVGLLRHIGAAGKTLDELEEYCRVWGLSHDRAAIRSLMSSYRIRHGFIDNPKNGFFRLTERALKFLDERYPEAQSETPPVGAGGVSDGSTQAALEGGIESGDLA